MPGIRTNCQHMLANLNSDCLAISFYEFATSILLVGRCRSAVHGVLRLAGRAGGVRGVYGYGWGGRNAWRRAAGRWPGQVTRLPNRAVPVCPSILTDSNFAAVGFRRKRRWAFCAALMERRHGDDLIGRPPTLAPGGQRPGGGGWGREGGGPSRWEVSRN